MGYLAVYGSVEFCIAFPCFWKRYPSALRHLGRGSWQSDNHRALRPKPGIIGFYRGNHPLLWPYFSLGKYSNLIWLHGLISDEWNTIIYPDSWQPKTFIETVKLSSQDDLQCPYSSADRARLCKSKFHQHSKNGEKPTEHLVGGDWNMLYFSIYWECHHPNWLIFVSEV